MSKRRNESVAYAPSEDLIKRLKSTGNDVNRLEDIVESRNIASVAAAFAVTLTDARSYSMNESKLKVRLSESKP